MLDTVCPGRSYEAPTCLIAACGCKAHSSLSPWYRKDIDTEALGKVKDLLDTDSTTAVFYFSYKARAAAHECGDLFLRVSEVFSLHSK